MKNDPLDARKPTLDDLSSGHGHLIADSAARSRRTAWALSLAGFLPFAFFAGCLLWLEPGHPLTGIMSDSLKTYGAVILSFLGGIRWGLAMKSAAADGRRIAFVLSVIPPLAGWAAIFMPDPVSFGVLAVAFAGQGAWDSMAGHNGIVGLWFVRLRTMLTFLVTVALVAALFARA